ncbi:glutaredoxin-C9-like [Rhodamnia argentea]|uniref:Glutaredoxin-C9-like n=1 Tax=Rhodamnia argentea TaxID=178133 RepID=A0A8B8QQE3_9MYRT|nr:glutaredoxin-C9-like [Rhodamnia argentea]
MQQAISYEPSPFPVPAGAGSRNRRRSALPLNRSSAAAGGGQQREGKEEGEGELASVRERTRRAVTESAVVVFGKRGCCMSHVVNRLLQGHGANPAVREFGDEDEAAVVGELERISGGGRGGVQFPAVFVGGKLFGGLDRVMTTHITGELVPALKEAGALWL